MRPIAAVGVAGVPGSANSTKSSNSTNTLADDLIVLGVLIDLIKRIVGEEETARTECLSAVQG